MRQWFTRLVLVGLFATAAPWWAFAEQKTPAQHALDLLVAAGQNSAPLRIKVLFENGMYRAAYDMAGAGRGNVCPQGGDVTVPVGVEVEINVTSNDDIVRWAIPKAGFDVLATPGRIDSARITLAEPGRYQVQPPLDNTDKISDVPLQVLSGPDFYAWFKHMKPCL
jgi:heme/copper-type cytochrome/quinol oxidase subunit 2